MNSQTERYERYEKTRKKNGFCPRCGGQRSNKSFSYCEACREYKRDYYKRNRTKELTRRRKEYESDRAKYAAQAVKQRVRRRRLVFDAYGGSKCSCCGEKEELFLSIDHIEGGGVQHRKSIGAGSSTSLYNWLIKNRFPDGFQVLCMNCNHGKFRNGGVCPHKQQT